MENICQHDFTAPIGKKERVATPYCQICGAERDITLSRGEKATNWLKIVWAMIPIAIVLAIIIVLAAQSCSDTWFKECMESERQRWEDYGFTVDAADEQRFERYCRS